MSDIFDETEENLRADKWVSIVKKALPWVSSVLGGALIIALGVWGWQGWQSHVSSASSETYEAAFEAAQKGDMATAKTKYEEASRTSNAAYKSMALLQLGVMAANDNKTEEAIKDFDQAAKVTSDPIASDTAALRAAMLAMDTASFADMQKRLTPLAKDGRPFAALAKEALAMAKLQAGDVKGARSDLQVLSLTLGTPDGVKQRAAEYLLAIDSGAVPTAKAAMALPEAKAPVIPQLQAPQMPAQ